MLKNFSKIGLIHFSSKCHIVTLIFLIAFFFFFFHFGRKQEISQDYFCGNQHHATNAVN